jgi:hypothetical protein
MKIVFFGLVSSSVFPGIGAAWKIWTAYVQEVFRVLKNCGQTGHSAIPIPSKNWGTSRLSAVSSHQPSAGIRLSDVPFRLTTVVLE